MNLGIKSMHDWLMFIEKNQSLVKKHFYILVFNNVIRLWFMLKHLKFQMFPFIMPYCHSVVMNSE